MTTSIDPQRFRSQATGGGATRAQAEANGTTRQYRVWHRATEAARKLMGKDKSRAAPQVPPSFADSSQF